MPQPLFEILGPLRNMQVIAAGRGVRVRKYLQKEFGGREWRKMKGVALVRDIKGDVYEAEIHWFERTGSDGGLKGSSGRIVPINRIKRTYPFYALCIELGTYKASLQIGKAYKIIRPEANDPEYFLRVIDEEGEDYLYPSEWFVPVELPPAAKRKLAAATA